MTLAKIKTCTHPSVEYRWWYEGAWSPIAFLHPHDARVCRKCGAWLSLGPSRDTPETAIEVRAAELAEAVFDVRRTNRTALLSELGFNGAETAGWLECMYDSDKLPEQPGEQAGYLARVIAEHNDGGTP